MAAFGSPQIPLTTNGGIVQGLWPVVPSTTTPAYVDLVGVQQCLVMIVVSNTTGVTGSAITLKQATSSGGANEKALAFTKAYVNLDVSAGTSFTELVVSNNTFTTNNTSNKKMIYLIEVDVFASGLDIKSNFNYLRVGTGDSTNATVGVWYILQK